MDYLHGQKLRWKKKPWGKNPTDRGKNGTKRSILVDEHGLPLSIVVSGANEHDVTLLAKTLDAIVVPRPKETKKKKQNLRLDAGYTGEEHRKSVEARGYILHIRSRGDEKKEIEPTPKFKARRWVVEVTHSWINRFRKLLVRFEKKAKRGGINSRIN